jgi:hypothetical protein
VEHQQQPEPGDDFQAEVGDVRSGVDVTSPEPGTSPLAPRRTIARRVSGAAVIAAAILLALSVVVSASPALRAPALGVIQGLHPTPTATMVPGEDLFYLLPNPPGVDVSLDGKVLSRVPAPGDPHPLRLAPGRHVFAWRSHEFPFQPLQCTVSVPHVHSDTCPNVARQFLPTSMVDLPGNVIALRESMIALAPDEAARLSAAIQAALDARQSTALVEPGEKWYFFSQTGTGQAGGPVQARQPLRATLSYSFMTNPGYPEPCTLGQPAIPCRFAGQDCGHLCTVAQPPPSLAGAGGETAWIAGAMVDSTWNYTTMDGHVVGQAIGDAFNAKLAALRIQWDKASGWHVTAIMGHTPGLDLADDAACDPARYALSQTPSWSFMLNSPPPGAQVRFASDATPADGCVAVLDQAPGDGQPAIFLYRFGVLLTVNDVAVNPVDNLPAADAAERALAAQLMAQL